MSGDRAHMDAVCSNGFDMHVSLSWEARGGGGGEQRGARGIQGRHDSCV